MPEAYAENAIRPKRRMRPSGETKRNSVRFLRPNSRSQYQTMDPSECTSYDGCNAPLCPLDPGIDLRIWYADEPICRSHTHGKRRWIRKQRSIVRRGTRSWMDKVITYQMLYDASRPMRLTDEQRESLRQRMKKTRGVHVLADENHQAGTDWHRPDTAKQS